MLHVDASDLVGREWRLAMNRGSHVRAIDAIRVDLGDQSSNT
jgi:hypothetical protein